MSWLQAKSPQEPRRQGSRNPFYLTRFRLKGRAAPGAVNRNLKLLRLASNFAYFSTVQSRAGTTTFVSCTSINPLPVRFSSSGKIESTFSRVSMNSILMGS